MSTSQLNAIVRDEAEHMVVAPGTQLLVDIEGVGKRLRSNIIGCHSPDFLLITTPRLSSGESMRDQYYLGRSVVGRYVAQGRVRGFRSQILQAIRRTRELIFLSYPDSFEEVVLRQSPRYPAYLTARLRSGEQEYCGHIRDIGRGGLCFRTQDYEGWQQLLEQPVSSEVDLPSGQPIQLSGKVKFAESDGAALDVGVSFQDLSDEFQKRLEDYLGNLVPSLGMPEESSEPEAGPEASIQAVPDTDPEPSEPDTTAQADNSQPGEEGPSADSDTEIDSEGTS